MSPEPPTPPHPIEARLAQIDARPFIGMVLNVAREVSPATDLYVTQNMLKLSVRCACLLDDFSESDDMAFLKEFNNQKDQFYKFVPNRFHDVLHTVENDVKQYFEHERRLSQRIRGGDQFSWHDIQNYVLGKSGDNLFYGKILELTVPGWTPDHTAALRTQTILFDIGKDIRDYADDVRQGLPNVLYMGLTNSMKPAHIPHDGPGAVIVATYVGLDRRIVYFADMFRKKVLQSALRSSPTLHDAIEQRYYDIQVAMHPY